MQTDPTRITSDAMAKGASLQPPVRISYGQDTLQFGDLRLPAGDGPHPVVMVIHGGFWRPAYTLDQMGELCTALAAAGLATWNLEYRGIGCAGGGWPGTFDDVVKAADHLGEVALEYPLDRTNVVIVGFSAGGQLALLLGSRIPVRGVVSLAGVVDLRRAWELGVGHGLVETFLGGSPTEVPDNYLCASPKELLPLGIPQRLVHGTEDDVVPLEISDGYTKAAKAAGDDARLIAIPKGSHRCLIDPQSAEWPVIRDAISDLSKSG